ncbi:hypothetical protein [Clostridioides sp. ZZV15-6597]|uniref:hypothetical protein n=1 Tax=Clostridioides sp. ZZV15-6597 TaxID=2811500 RepID=UPI001D10D20A|nr:hypothetical protein [Clostridioides sp. ZZV15-6597]HBF1820581.1 hypothetical protein [Clostridioides difficile]
MKPEKDNDVIQIPISFDISSKGLIEANGRVFWVILIIVFWIISSIFIVIASPVFFKLFYPILSFIILLFITRFLVLRETYFKNKRKELLENNYLFKHTIFWNICDFNNRYPYTVQYANNKKAIFVALNHGVTTNSNNSTIYNHHDYIAEAYQQLAKKNIPYMHIDYMSTVDKDDRMKDLFNWAEKADNSDLGELLTIFFDNMQSIMKQTYTSHDVYVFFFNEKDDLFWSELKPILSTMLKAKYKGYKVLNKSEIGDLAKELMNINEFCPQAASEEIFKDIKDNNFIKVIWVESDGVRTRINKTKEELEETKRTAIAEYKAQKLFRKEQRKKNKLTKRKSINTHIKKLLKKDSAIESTVEDEERIILLKKDDEVVKESDIDKGDKK